MKTSLIGVFGTSSSYTQMPGTKKNQVALLVIRHWRKATDTNRVFVDLFNLSMFIIPPAAAAASAKASKKRCIFNGPLLCALEKVHRNAG